MSHQERHGENPNEVMKSAAKETETAARNTDYKNTRCQNIRLCVVSMVTTGKQEQQHAYKEGSCDRRDRVHTPS